MNKVSYLIELSNKAERDLEYIMKRRNIKSFSEAIEHSLLNHCLTIQSQEHKKRVSIRKKINNLVEHQKQQKKFIINNSDLQVSRSEIK